MSTFKFSCPVCQQRIGMDAEFVGRRVDCPSCKATLKVPAAPESESVLPVAELVTAPAGAKPTAAPSAAAPQAPKPPDPAATEAPPVFPPLGGAKPESEPTRETIPTPTKLAEKIGNERVAVLTPAIKLEIVRDMRSRIADKARWLPGKHDAGGYNYAGKLEGDRVVPLGVTDASATHFSLFGAVLLEFHRRNVVRVTHGRTKFLDEELIQAIQHVLGRDNDKTPVSEAEREALTHDQCLAVLDCLEQRYVEEAKSTRKQQAQRKVDNVRLSDLVEKLEKKSAIRPEDVACALFYELEEVNQRLAELEKKLAAKE